MKTSKAGLSPMLPPEWARSCWGCCPRCGRWGTRWGSWRVCQCCWACCTASTWSCCGASPGSWSSSARTLTPGRRFGAGAGCSSFSGCSTGLRDSVIIDIHVTSSCSAVVKLKSAPLFTDLVFNNKLLCLLPICTLVPCKLTDQRYFSATLTWFVDLKGHFRDLILHFYKLRRLTKDRF